MLFSVLTQVCFAISLGTFSLVSAYRPVQHCKRAGDNGHYSACAALTQSYNATTQASDLYLRYHWYLYRKSNRGWHAFAIGERMEGAFMLVMYGDPVASPSELTISVRTADGNRPPRPIEEYPQYNTQLVPQVEVITARFEKYTGTFHHQVLKLKPSHMGVAEVIIRAYSSWSGTPVDSRSTHQPMLWSSNHDQDFSSDYSADRGLEAHQFGAGHGFLWVDMANAQTPFPLFGPIEENGGLKGSSEVAEPDAPTEEELAAGELYIAQMLAQSPASADLPGSHEDMKTPSTTKSGFASIQTVPGHRPFRPPGSDDVHASDSPPLEQPARTVLGKTVRDWMWHLHGILMIVSFLGLYPLGVYLLRNPPENGNGFNFHWTIQALASVCTGLGAIIGYYNSYGISVLHQYIGIFMVASIGVQLLLGWRHHIIFVATKRRTLLATSHMWIGRTLLPLGFINILLGMLLRKYGWLTMTLVIIAIVLEAAYLVYSVRGAGSRNARIDSGGSNAVLQQDDAEEYFQLGGVDDDDEFSDDEAEAAEAQRRQEEKRQQAERLSKLDRV